MNALRTFGTSCLLASLMTIGLSCAESPPPAKTPEPAPEATQKNESAESTPKDDPCKEKDGSSKSCESDKDCCKGYTCGHDPERSHVQHYCVGG
ncbi:MAG: hypothetical protein U0263_06125 [Polyangiaceae bacterium]